jgi:hypothetical protein
MVKSIAEPTAESRSDDQPHGTARDRPDRSAAADTDGFFLGGTVLFRGPARRSQQAADQQYDDFALHDSLLSVSDNT